MELERNRAAFAKKNDLRSIVFPSISFFGGAKEDQAIDRTNMSSRLSSSSIESISTTRGDLLQAAGDKIHGHGFSVIYEIFMELGSHIGSLH